MTESYLSLCEARDGFKRPLKEAVIPDRIFLFGIYATESHYCGKNRLAFSLGSFHVYILFPWRGTKAAKTTSLRSLCQSSCRTYPSKKFVIDQELGLLFQNTHNHEAFLILFNLLNVFLFQRS